MKKFFTFCLFLALLTFSYAYPLENYQEIKEIIENVNINKLVKGVREITGEDSVIINNKLELIRTRNIQLDSGYTKLAEEYIIQKLNEYGYFPKTDTFYHSLKFYNNPNSPYFYRHIYAEKTGTKYPDKKIYICPF